MLLSIHEGVLVMINWWCSRLSSVFLNSSQGLRLKVVSMGSGICLNILHFISHQCFFPACESMLISL